MNPETTSPMVAVQEFVMHRKQSAASFVIIARNKSKTIWILVVDCPNKYGTTSDRCLVRRIGFPGGKAETSETSRQTAEREVLEEVGLQINLDSSTSELIFDLKIINGDMWRSPHILTVFSTFEFNGKIILGKDIKRAFWVPIQDLLNRRNLLGKHRVALEIFARKYT